MKRTYRALALALALAVCAGCGRGGAPTEPTPLPSASAPVATATPSPSPTPSPEPSEEAPLVWTTDGVLREDEMPGSYNGLELPIQGATGYAVVAIPLWADPADAQRAAQAYADWEARQAAQKAAEPQTAATLASLFVLTAAAAEPEEDAPETPAAEPTPTPDAPAVPEATATPEPAGETTPAAPELPEATEPPEGETQPAETPEVPAETPEPTPAPEQPSEAPTPEPTPEPSVEPAPSLTAGSLKTLPAGTAFTVLNENGDWWQIRSRGETGWVEHRWCMVNLPDVIPSMIFNDTNSYSSKFVSCGKNLSGVTGQALYQAKAQNPRLGREEFMMPVLYSMAKRLAAAQRAALAEGNCLVLYEGYRPFETQKQVSNALSKLIRQDAEVRRATCDDPWSISWFIATGASNHQHGYAVDVSLARVRDYETAKCGKYAYLRVTDWEEYAMPTAMHELSSAAATFTKPVSPNSKTAWRGAKLAPTMTDTALGLQGYCTGAGLSPLASEWWHFNDLDSRERVLSHLGVGQFTIQTCLSVTP